jgi:predicted Zn-dependent protease
MEAGGLVISFQMMPVLICWAKPWVLSNPLAQYSQSNKNEADDYAMAFLKKHNHSPESAVSTPEKLAELSGGDSNWLSTHPSTKSRVERMRKALA